MKARRAIRPEPAAPDIFGAAYAGIYDSLYRDKPYAREVAFVCERFQAATGRTPQRVLDLACGTGNHFPELQRRGISGHANDLSAAMLERAQARVAATPAFSFSCCPMQELRLNARERGEGFDLTMAFYTALGYLTAPVELDACLRRIPGWLRPGGLFFGDLWNGHRITRDFEPRRERRISGPEWEGTRISEVTAQPDRNALHTHFTCQVTERRTGRTRRFEEDHLVRYFTPTEWETLLLAHGFELIECAPFFEPDETLASCWNFYFLARRKDN
jgi:SAM-dependent methyltransferase